MESSEGCSSAVSIGQTKGNRTKTRDRSKITFEKLSQEIFSFEGRSLGSLGATRKLLGVLGVVGFLSLAGCNNGGGGGGSEAGQPLNQSPKKRSDPKTRACKGGVRGPGIINGEKLANDAPLASSTVNVMVIRKIDTSTGVVQGMACTGTLVSEDVVLTAAHCFDAGPNDGPIRQVSVYFGTDYECEVAQGLQVDQESMRGMYRVHPQWSPEAKGMGPKTLSAAMNRSQYDIALLALENPAPSYKKPARLASNLPESAYGQDVYFAGFGKDTPGYSTPPDDDSMLRWVNLQFLNDGAYKNSAEGPMFQINNMNKGICRGDSGGPGFILSGGNFYQVGVNSFVTSANGQDSGFCQDRSYLVNLLNHKQFIRDNFMQLTKSAAPVDPFVEIN